MTSTTFGNSPTDREVFAFTMGMNHSRLIDKKMDSDEILLEERFVATLLHIKREDYRRWRELLVAKAIHNNESFLQFAMKLLNSKRNQIAP